MSKPDSTGAHSHVSGISITRLVIWVLIIGTVLLLLAFNAVLPWEGRADAGGIDPKALADLALASTQYVQGLTTAVLGGFVLLLMQGQVRHQLGPGRRRAVAAGATLLVLSLLTGFVTIEVVVAAADERLIDARMEHMRWLRLLQSTYLLLGVVCIGVSFLWEVVFGTSKS